jgi:hypothetical protein
MGMMLGFCALAACSRAEQPPARQTADAAPDSASVASAAPTADAPAADAPYDSAAAWTVRIHPTLPPHTFAVHQEGPEVVDSIVVWVDGRRVQTLRPRENHVIADAETERLSTLDLDFDGYADLALLTMLAMANSTSEYWRFDPAARRFVPAGEFETLTPDSAARELTHYNRGGHGGRLWTAARWRWADTALVLVSEEEQDALGDGERYVHIVRQPRGGRMVEVRRDTLEGEELRSSPSWAEP